MSLNNKLNFLILIVVLPLIFLMGFHSVSNQDRMNKEIFDLAPLLATSYSRAVATSVLIQDEADLLAQTIEFIKQNNIAHVSVYDVEGVRLAAKGIQLPKLFPDAQTYFKSNHNLFYRQGILDDSNEPIGHVIIGLDTTFIENELTKNLVINISVSFFLCFLAGVFTYKLARSIISPIQELTRASIEIAEGDLDTLISLPGVTENEVAQLSSAMNKMRESLIFMLKTEAGHVREKEKLLGDLEANHSELATSYHELNTSKNLLSVICHDMANPLTVCMGNNELVSSLLNDSKVVDGENDKMARIQKSMATSQRAMTIMHDLLNSVRTMHADSSGKVELNLKPVAIHDVVDHCNFILKDRLEKKEVTINFIDKISGCVFALADKTSLANSVALNILTNALKFSHRGNQIKIEAELQDDWIIMSITDYGPGIPENNVDKIFEIGSPTTTKGTGGEKGTGFGLPLAKYFMEAYGGKITVKSKHIDSHPTEHGTTFYLHLPKASDAPDAVNDNIVGL